MTTVKFVFSNTKMDFEKEINDCIQRQAIDNKVFFKDIKYQVMVDDTGNNLFSAVLIFDDDV